MNCLTLLSKNMNFLRPCTIFGLRTRTFSVKMQQPVILQFDGNISDTSIFLLNKLNKREFPLCYQKDERLSLGHNVKIIMETQHLTNLELSMLHNTSVVKVQDYYLSDFQLLESRLAKLWKPDSYFHEFLNKSTMLLTQFIDFCSASCDPMIVSDVITIENSFLNLFEGILKIVFDEDQRWKTSSKSISKLAFFCALWAVFPTISVEDQAKVDNYVRKAGTDVPVYGTVFDFYIDKESLEWEHWRKHMKEWKYDPDSAHSAIYIQTIHYIRCEYFFNILLKQGNYVLLVGPKGSGKSSVIREFLSGLRGGY